MADIAVFHPSLMTGGGGEAVCAHTLAAIADDHSITVYSTDQVDIQELNRFHGTDIDPGNVKTVTLIPKESRLIDSLSNIASKIVYETKLEFLRKALAQVRLSDYIISDHELYVSTWNELFISEPTVQYIHFPTYHGGIQNKYDPRSSSSLFKNYYRLCSILARSFGSRNDESSIRTLANSTWTAKLVKEAYDIDAEVVFPPVHVDEFNPLPWDEKEPGFVAIGRIHPLKQQVNMIKIIDALRERGFDTHLHIIGPTGDANYKNKVSNLAAKRNHIKIHGKVPRSTLVEMVDKHRYGIHGREFEHFGIAVAEMVAGGAIPFVPDSGGQVDIVNQMEQLTYDSINDATEKVATVLNNGDLQKSIRQDLREKSESYSSHHFECEIKSIIESEL